MKIVLTELYIILVYEKFYFFLFILLSMDQKVVFMIIILRAVTFLNPGVR